MKDPPCYRGIVRNILPGNDPYAVVECDGVPDLVTVSLGAQRGVWEDSSLPVVGSAVILSDVQCVHGKWRAYNARLFKPSDGRGVHG